MEKFTEEEKHKIANNCRKATFLIEKQQFGEITRLEKLELALHLKNCEICTIYMKQSALINEYSKKIFVSGPGDLKLEDKDKQQIRDALNRKLGKK